MGGNVVCKCSVEVWTTLPTFTPTIGLGICTYNVHLTKRIASGLSHKYMLMVSVGVETFSSVSCMMLKRRQRSVNGYLICFQKVTAVMLFFYRRFRLQNRNTVAPFVHNVLANKGHGTHVKRPLILGCVLDSTIIYRSYIG